MNGFKMYDELCTALDSANSNDDILFTVFTGEIEELFCNLQYSCT